jgi:hypothetical protein
MSIEALAKFFNFPQVAPGVLQEALFKMNYISKMDICGKLTTYQFSTTDLKINKLKSDIKKLTIYNKLVIFLWLNNRLIFKSVVLTFPQTNTIFLRNSIC